MQLLLSPMQSQVQLRRSLQPSMGSLRIFSVFLYSNNPPAYEKVFNAFSRKHLQKLLMKFQAEVRQLENDRALVERYALVAHKQIYKTMEGMDRSSMFSSTFAATFPTFWQSITVQEHKATNHHLLLLLMRSQIMAAVGSAWSWLDVQLPAMCLAILRGEGECLCCLSYAMH